MWRFSRSVFGETLRFTAPTRKSSESCETFVDLKSVVESSENADLIDAAIVAISKQKRSRTLLILDAR